MKITIVEGTPEEIGQAFPNLRADLVRSSTPTEVQVPASGDGVTYVPISVARAAISRRALSKEQREVLTAIYKAGSKGILATKLQKLIGYTPAQFAGLMGAFGRRVSHTPGYTSPNWFFDQDWDYEAGCYQYSLPETVREAVRLEKLV